MASKPKKENIGAMSRGKVKDELRRCKNENEAFRERLRVLKSEIWWLRNYTKLIESSGD